MTSHRGLLILVGLAPALVVMGACPKAEQQTTRPPADTSKMTSDTSHMMTGDTSHKMAADTAKAAPAKPAAPAKKKRRA